MTECTCGADGLNATWDAVNRIIKNKTNVARLKSWVGAEEVHVVTAEWKDSFEYVLSKIGSDTCIVGIGTGDTISFYKIDELRIPVPKGTSQSQSIPPADPVAKERELHRQVDHLLAEICELRGSRDA